MYIFIFIDLGCWASVDTYGGSHFIASGWLHHSNGWCPCQCILRSERLVWCWIEPQDLESRKNTRVFYMKVTCR